MGTIWLAATPIGNVEDASARLRGALETADCIAAEDTRRLEDLCRRLDLRYTGELVAFHDHNEAERTPELISRALAGETVLVVSDAGTPTVSDPGYRLAEAAVAAGVPLRPLPGPSAALAALSVSGFPSDRFAFEGFLPRKPGEARRRLKEAAPDPRTLIWFESPRRLKASLALMAEGLGPDRPAAVCRELTKTHEEILRGSLGELAEAIPADIRGEITVVTRGADPESLAAASLPEAALEVGALVAGGMRLKPAVAQVAARTGVAKNELYRAALENR